MYLLLHPFYANNSLSTELDGLMIEVFISFRCSEMNEFCLYDEAEAPEFALIAPKAFKTLITSSTLHHNARKYHISIISTLSNLRLADYDYEDRISISQE